MKLLAKEVARKPQREAWEARRLRQRFEIKRTTTAAECDATLVSRRIHTCCCLGVARIMQSNNMQSVSAVERVEQQPLMASPRVSRGQSKTTRRAGQLIRRWAMSDGSRDTTKRCRGKRQLMCCRWFVAVSICKGRLDAVLFSRGWPRASSPTRPIKLFG